MLRRLSIFVLVILATACNKKSEYPGYTKSDNGIYYKLLAIGEDNQRINIGDFVTLDIEYKTPSDSIFFSAHRRFQISKPEFDGSIDDCLMLLGKGDRAEFITKAADFYLRTLKSPLPPFLKITDIMKLNINVQEVQTEADYQREREAFLSWISDFGEYEQTILKQYINQQKITAKPTASGLYLINQKKGNGKRVMPGDTVTVDYEGRFLNGKFFDSTVKRNESFTFVYGSEWQVIEGLQQAIGLMDEGQKALVIVPSHLAFGSEGSATGIIPPYTSLLFELELKQIKSKQ